MLPETMDTNDSCRQLKQSCSAILNENSERKCLWTIQTAVLVRSDIAKNASISVKGDCFRALKQDGLDTELIKTYCRKSCNNCGEYST